MFKLLLTVLPDTYPMSNPPTSGTRTTHRRRNIERQLHKNDAELVLFVKYSNVNKPTERPATAGIIIVEVHYYIISTLLIFIICKSQHKLQQIKP